MKRIGSHRYTFCLKTIFTYIGHFSESLIKIEALFMQVYKFLNISGGQYTGREVCFWEKIVLDKLEWYLTIPTVFTFLVRYAKAAKADKEVQKCNNLVLLCLLVL